MCISIKSIMFDVDGCPPLLTSSRVNVLLALRSEPKAFAYLSFLTGINIKHTRLFCDIHVVKSLCTCFNMHYLDQEMNEPEYSYPEH